MQQRMPYRSLRFCEYSPLYPLVRKKRRQVLCTPLRLIGMHGLYTKREALSIPFRQKTSEKQTPAKNIRRTIQRLTRDLFPCYFSHEYRNLRGESQTGRDAHRERGTLRTRGRFTGKWFAEGKGKRVIPEYPDRGLALRAECVLARS